MRSAPTDCRNGFTNSHCSLADQGLLSPLMCSVLPVTSLVTNDEQPRD
jgi:hypothetical protein